MIEFRQIDDGKSVLVHSPMVREFVSGISYQGPTVICFEQLAKFESRGKSPKPMQKAGHTHGR